MSYAEQAIDPQTGRIRSYAEIMEPKLRAQRGAQIADALARHEAEGRKTETEKRLEQARAALKDAKFQGDRERMALWRDHIEALTEQYEGEKAQAKREADFASNPRIAGIRSTVSVDSLALLFPASSRVDIETLHAISQSNSYPDSASLINDYDEIWDRLHAENLAAETAKSAELAQTAAKANMEHAESKARLAELAVAKQQQTGGTPDVAGS
jgi:hypothetical protein